MKISMILISVIVFSMATAGLYLVPMLDNTQGGYSFFTAYGFTPPAGNLSQLDYTSETYQKIQQIKCDLNPDPDECKGVSTNVYQKVTDFIHGMVQGGYSVLVTLTKTISIFESIITDIGKIMGIPEFIWQGFINIIAISIFITIALIIFNRSDSG